MVDIHIHCNNNQPIAIRLTTLLKKDIISLRRVWYGQLSLHAALLTLAGWKEVTYFEAFLVNTHLHCAAVTTIMSQC